MEWSEVSASELSKIELAPRASKAESQYKPLIQAVIAGKTIKVVLGDVSPKSMSQRLYTAAKNAGTKVSVRTLLDRSAVIVGPSDPAPSGEAPKKTK